MSAVAGMVSTYSKGMFLEHPGYPRSLHSARGARCWDRDGRSYIDWWSSLGAVLLGYAHPAVNRAVQRQLREGQCFSFPHYGEEQVAEQLCGAVPGMEQVRFAKNASDCVEAAIRLARKYTGRWPVATLGQYSGFHSDMVTSTSGKNGGVLPESEQMLQVWKGDWQAHVQRRAGQIAALLVEPVDALGVAQDWGTIKRALNADDALLIFDETICGFRYQYGSAVATIPDLWIFGKAIGNGFPLACLGGPRRLMDYFKELVFFSSTAAAESISLAAGLATLNILQSPAFYEKLHFRGHLFQSLCQSIDLPLCGKSPRFQFRFPTDQQRDSFLSGLALAGHLVGRDVFLQQSHAVSFIQQFKREAEVLKEGMR